jgi:CreA protein
MGGSGWSVDEAGALSTAWADNGAFVTCEDAMSLPLRPVITAWLLLAPLLLTPLVPAHAGDTIGEVDTVFKWIGPDHKIVVDAYDDPDVAGVTCYVSRAKTGGIKGGLGLAEDKAEASIACRQTGPISFPKPLRQQDEMFSERISLVFKKLRVVRMVDRPRNTLVYLTYSDRVIEGSPQNSVTAVPVDRGTPIPLR